MSFTIAFEKRKTRVYFSAFVIVLCVQLIRGFTYDITYMSHDDVTYTTFSSDAYLGNGILNINYNGIADVFRPQYSIVMWNVYPAYLSFVSGVSVATIAHTVQYVQLVVLAYITYWYFVEEILEERQNQLIAILIISVFYWFGYHSHYSLSFRLLGPNYQGKAVLAVSLSPFLLSLLRKYIDEEYSNIKGFFFLSCLYQVLH